MPHLRDLFCREGGRPRNTIGLGTPGLDFQTWEGRCRRSLIGTAAAVRRGRRSFARSAPATGIEGLCPRGASAGRDPAGVHSARGAFLHLVRREARGLARRCRIVHDSRQPLLRRSTTGRQGDPAAGYRFARQLVGPAPFSPKKWLNCADFGANRAPFARRPSSYAIVSKRVKFQSTVSQPEIFIFMLSNRGADVFAVLAASDGGAGKFRFECEVFPCHYFWPEDAPA